MQKQKTKLQKAQKEVAKQKNPAKTPRMKIEQVVGVTMPKSVKVMAALCHPTNRHQEKSVARSFLRAIVTAELDKRRNKKFTKQTDSEE
jgi:hypothetical protein